MNLTEMHVWFRQYVQQMGMQNTRAILPEQIDLCINTSITDTVNQLISQNIASTNDRIITDNSKIGQINAFSTLYKVLRISANPDDKTEIPPLEEIDPPLDTNTQVSNNDGGIPIEPEYTNNSPFNYGKESYIRKITADIKNLDNNSSFDYLFIVDMSLSYRNESGDFISNYFPVRIIDDAFLADTLNDFILRPKLRSPVAVVYKHNTVMSNGSATLDIYLDEVIKQESGKLILPNGLIPNEFRLSYIAKPAKVRYLKDFDQPNVDCDLPEYLHVDILKHAADLWHTAVNGALHSAQQQAQTQKQEDTRNSYRNEGT